MSQVVIEGFFIMVLFCAFGIIGTICFGPMADYIHDFGDAYITSIGVAPQYNLIDTASYFIDDLHLLLIFCPIIGVVIFILSILQKTRYDSYIEAEEQMGPRYW